MFPRALADGLFSLHMGRSTAAVSVHMTIHQDGSLDGFGLVASTVTPTRKLTYAEVDELLEVTMPEQEPTLWALHKVRCLPSKQLRTDTLFAVAASIRLYCVPTNLLRLISVLL